MMNNSHPIAADLVLIGGGHAHVHVLKMLGMPKKTITAGLRVTLITNTVHTPYSGMLPGYLAGHYTYDQIHLDLQRLCRFSGIRLVHAAAERITYDDGGGGGGFVYCHDGRPPIRYDCLSIDVGSAPAKGEQLEHVIPVKPIAHFAGYYQQLLDERLTRNTTTTTDDDDDSTKTIVVVGGGAGGLELALSLQYKLRHRHNGIRFVLVTRSAELLPQHNGRVRRIFHRVVRERGIRVLYNAHVRDVVWDKATRRKRLVMNGTTDPTSSPSLDDVLCDDCLWCVSACAPRWLAEQTPLATTPEGFVRVHDTLECLHRPGVFAAGDCCHMDRHPRPKAGVFAVRAGPPLLENIFNYLHQKPLVAYRPQRDFLGIISTGDPYAVATKGNWLAIEGAWVWRWKDWIDRNWMAKYQHLPDRGEMMAKMQHGHARQKEAATALARSKGRDVLEAFDADPMRCGGCGAKVGSTTVGRVLRAVHERQVKRAVRWGLETPPPLDHDDAAIQPLPRGGDNRSNGNAPALIQTIDYFREMVADPFIFGKIVAVHALSDVHAMGATAQTALSLAVAPFAADESITESTLLHLLSGVSDIMQDEGVRMVGGHTCEGLELACGLSIQGYTEQPESLLRKRGGRVGDQIVLTKPLGTGALFAADMRAECKGEYVVEAIESMIKSNVTAGQTAIKSGSGVRSCTDVTGFGLIGHLLEMLMANEDDRELGSIGAVLSIRDIPFLRGGIEASRNQIFSTLQPQNVRNRRAVANHSEAAQAYPIEYPLLFDPQTAGGLMFFVDPNQCDAFIGALQKKRISAAVIGKLEPYPSLAAEPTTMTTSEGPTTEPAVCTIGSGGAVTGQRIRIAL